MKKARFTYRIDAGYSDAERGARERDGQIVEVLRAISEDSLDSLTYEIRFADGIINEAFPEELEFLGEKGFGA